MQTNGHSKNYQVPKTDHPWRRYKNRPVTQDSPEDLISDKDQPSIFNFLKDIVENWETYTIPGSDIEGGNYVKIKNITKVKQAEWLAGFMRKTWVRKEIQDFL